LLWYKCNLKFTIIKIKISHIAIAEVHKSNFVYQVRLLHMLLRSDYKFTIPMKSVSSKDHSILMYPIY